MAVATTVPVAGLKEREEERLHQEAEERSKCVASDVN